MKQQRLTCILVGLGRIGWNFHLPQILGNPHFHLAAVVDSDPLRLQEARNSYGIAGWRTLHEVPDRFCDLAVLATPTQFHRCQAIECMEKGMDVFCDKPVALNAAEAQAMQEEARLLHRKIMVYQPYRISTETLTAQAVIASGKLGKIYKIRKTCHSFQRRNDWQSLRQSGGGMLMNYGAHFIDQLLFLGKQAPVSISSSLQKILSAGDSEDVVSMLMEGGEGLTYELSINMADALPESSPSMIIYGDLGTAVSGFRPDEDWKIRYCLQQELPSLQLNSALEARNREYPSEDIRWHEEKFSARKEDLTEYYRQVYAYFRLDGAPLVPFEETVRIMQIISACAGICSQSAPDRQPFSPSLPNSGK